MLTITQKPLTLDEFIAVVRDHQKVALSDEVKAMMQKSRDIVEKVLQEEKPVYGINTGFGELSSVFIPSKEREQLQTNLILSHCTGVGAPLEEEIVRGVILLRISSLSKGYSGIRVSTVEKLVELLNKDICPYIPCQGSVGASGDLAPLAHMAAVLLGEGFVLVNGKAVESKQVLREKDFAPISLAGKEGLALINGTQVMTSIGALACHDAIQLVKIADIAAALSLEALKGTRAAFDTRVSDARAHKGQLSTAKNILKLTEDSAIIESHHDCEKVQDAYSLRCVPQVHGASKDALNRVLDTINVEINAVTDNPLIMPDGDIISCGNFHGQPVALVMDYLKLAISELGNISERRVNRLVDPSLSGLPAFLTPDAGVNSGLMIAQYTCAALASENKVLVHPASADSIPTSANQEDHVSMGTIGARQAREILENVRHIIAIEIMAACQGIDFLPDSPGKGTSAAHQKVRSFLPKLEEDRLIAPDIAAVHQAVVKEEILHAVEDAVGMLEH